MNIVRAARQTLSGTVYPAPILAIGLMAVTVLFAPQAHADLVTNGSFETGTNPPTAGNNTSLSVGSTAITGWTVVDGSGNPSGNTDHNLLWIGNGAFGLSTPFGTDFLDLTGTSDATPFVGVTQTLATVAGQSYALTFDLGVESPANGGPFAGPITVNVSTGASTTTLTDTGTSGTTTSDGTVWTDETLDFTATSAATAITFIGETGDQFIGLDNVSVNGTGSPPPNPVPEPAALALLSSALLGLGAIRYGRRD
jgi:hypothetical protein